jgi:hypothetical protein
MSETKSGMPSPALTEDDVRRIVIDVLKENERLNMERMLAPLGYAIVKQPDTTGDQVECADSKVEWEKYSPTAD